VVPVTAWVAGSALAAALLVAAGRPRASRAPGPARAAAPLAHATSSIRRALERAVPGRRLARRDALLPDALDRLAAAIRAGQSIGPALVELAATAPDPLGPELRGVAARLAHGAPVATALAGWAGSPGASADVRLVAAALTLGAEAGGEVARAVDRVSVTLRERAELRGEVRALATQARASAAVLTLAPLGFAVLVASVEPDAIAFLLTTPIGWLCLTLGLALDAVGALWMSRITRRAA
jgi:tight adherence protein B